MLPQSARRCIRVRFFPKSYPLRPLRTFSTIFPGFDRVLRWTRTRPRRFPSKAFSPRRQKRIAAGSSLPEGDSRAEIDISCKSVDSYCVSTRTTSIYFSLLYVSLRSTGYTSSVSISALTVYLIATRTFCTVHARKGYKTTLRLETCLNLKYTHFWHSNEIFIKSSPCTETSSGKLSSSRATFAILFVVLRSAS